MKTFQAIALAGMWSMVLLGGSEVVQANPDTMPNAPKPLTVSEGTAQDLSGTLAKDASLWLGGVGGENDLPSETDTDYLSAPSQDQTTYTPAPDEILSPRPNAAPTLRPLPLTQF